MSYGINELQTIRFRGRSPLSNLFATLLNLIILTILAILWKIFQKRVGA